MFVPIAVVSVDELQRQQRSRNVYAFQGFTLNNWTHLYRQPNGMCEAVVRSVGSGLAATLVATVPARSPPSPSSGDFVGRSAANTVIFLPMASPRS